MESSRALKIVSALADGIDPESGEVLAAERVFQHPEVVCALKLAVVALEQLSGRQKRHKPKTGKADVVRTEVEEKQLPLEI